MKTIFIQIHFKIIQTFNLLDHVHFPWRMNVRMPTMLVQIIDRLTLLSTNIALPDHFCQSDRNSNQQRTMKSPGRSTDQPIYGQCKTILKYDQRKSDFIHFCKSKSITFKPIHGINIKIEIDSLTTVFLQFNQTAN